MRREGGPGSVENKANFRSARGPDGGPVCEKQSQFPSPDSRGVGPERGSVRPFRGSRLRGSDWSYPPEGGTPNGTVRGSSHKTKPIPHGIRRQATDVIVQNKANFRVVQSLYERRDRAKQSQFCAPRHEGQLLCKKEVMSREVGPASVQNKANSELARGLGGECDCAKRSQFRDGSQGAWRTRVCETKPISRRPKGRAVGPCRGALCPFVGANDHSPVRRLRGTDWSYPPESGTPNGDARRFGLPLRGPGR